MTSRVSIRSHCWERLEWVAWSWRVIPCSQWKVWWRASFLEGDAAKTLFVERRQWVSKQNGVLEENTARRRVATSSRTGEDDLTTTLSKRILKHRGQELGRRTGLEEHVVISATPLRRHTSKPGNAVQINVGYSVETAARTDSAWGKNELSETKLRDAPWRWIWNCLPSCK